METGKQSNAVKEFPETKLSLGEIMNLLPEVFVPADSRKDKKLQERQLCQSFQNNTTKRSARKLLMRQNLPEERNHQAEDSKNGFPHLDFLQHLKFTDERTVVRNPNPTSLPIVDIPPTERTRRNTTQIPASHPTDSIRLLRFPPIKVPVNRRSLVSPTHLMAIPHILHPSDLKRDRGPRLRVVLLVLGVFLPRPRQLHALIPTEAAPRRSRKWGLTLDTRRIAIV